MQRTYTSSFLLQHPLLLLNGRPLLFHDISIRIAQNSLLSEEALTFSFFSNWALRFLCLSGLDSCLPGQLAESKWLATTWMLCHFVGLLWKDAMRRWLEGPSLLCIGPGGLMISKFCWYPWIQGGLYATALYHAKLWCHGDDCCSRLC